MSLAHIVFSIAIAVLGVVGLRYDHRGSAVGGTDNGDCQRRRDRIVRA